MFKNLAKEIKILINFIPKREQDVINRRFGLFNKKQETLESIGRFYGITRERVRQIQDHGIHSLKNKILPSNVKFQKNIESIDQKIEELGGVANEENFLKQLQQKDEDKNYLRLLFVLNKNLSFLKEDDKFFPRWAILKKKEDVLKIEAALNSLIDSMSNDIALSFEEVINKFKNNLQTIFGGGFNYSKAIICSWFGISKFLNQNIFGEWGLATSYFINPKGVRDYAYLSMRRHGSPMHFKEVAAAIQSNFSKPAHIQTVHNELIKDQRFVLVGRGLYALKEWGYISGTVRDVIYHILSNNPKISKEELIKRILKERHVQPTTITINLQNRKFFKKFPHGTYG